jgi:flavin reductase (DIM6/NTAB) family NADH-FMN oxidoreductase RutF
MFYEPDKKNHGLQHSPYKSCMVPRPIGWISTQSRSGRINLAPFSQFNNVGYEPGYLMFSGGGQHPDGGRKDTVTNAEETGEFVYNMATFDLREAVSLSAQITDSGVDEMEAAGLTPAPSRLVKPPRVAESPISIECKYYTTVILPGLDWKTTHHVVIGRVVGVHIKDEYIDADGKIDIVKIRPLARLGYTDYTSVESTFTLELSDATREFLTWGMSGGD